MILNSEGNGGGDKADTVSVCGQVRLGRKISFDADQWFGEYLSTSTATGKTGKTVTCTLLRCDVQIAAPKGAQEDTKKNEKEKEKEKENAETSKGSSKNKSDNNGTDISFANTAQFLLLSLESVKALTQVMMKCSLLYSV